MKPADILAVVGSTPHTSRANGQDLYDFIRKHRLARCLELGVAHGVATVWMAGAVESLGGGKVVGVDLLQNRYLTPSAWDLTARAGLSDLVELHNDPISYTWHLKRNWDNYIAEPFDFVFIDGAHTWDTDGFAFFLVSRILKPGGWSLFDDLNWTYEKLTDKSRVKDISEEELTTPQVRDIWELLVLRDPAFGNFIESRNWGWAQKVSGDEPRRLEVRHANSLLHRLNRKLLRQMRSIRGRVGLRTMIA